jgi:hypothetical protein
MATATSGAAQVTISYQTIADQLSVSAATGTYGGATSLTATLNPAVSGKTIVFSLNGSQVCDGPGQPACPTTGDGTNGTTLGVATLANVSLAGINAGTYPAGGSCNATTASDGVFASFGGDSYSASTGCNTLTVDKANPVLTWPAPAAITYGTTLDGTQLDASATFQNNPVDGTFLYDPASGTLLNAGQGQTLTTTFTPADATDFNPVSTSVAIDVNQASTALSAVSGSGTYGGSATLTATLTSASALFDGKTISFTLNGNAVCGGSTGVACPTTNSNGVATLTNVGLTGIDAGTVPGAVGAGFAGDSSYSGSTGSGALMVAQANQTITFGTLSNHTYGDAPFTVSATASSGLPVSFAVTGPCTITGNTVIITGAGTCTVTASQSGNANYSAPPSVSQTCTIARTASSTTVTSSVSPSVVGQAVTFSARVSPASATGTVQFSVDGANSGGPVAVTNGSAALTTAALSAGSHTVTAVYSGNPNVSGSSASVTQLVRYGVKLLYKSPVNGNVGSIVPIKLELTDAAGKNLTSSGLTVQALCVVAAPASGANPCAPAPAGFNWTTGSVQSFSYLSTLATGGGYQYNVKTTGLKSGTTYQLLFRVAGEDAGSYHVDGGATFTLSM